MKNNTLVRFDVASINPKYQHEYPFSESDRFVYMGDIVQMPGHCVVVRLGDGKVFTCYHTDDFIELVDKEVKTEWIIDVS